MIRRIIIIILLFILTMLLERAHPLELCCIPLDRFPLLRSEKELEDAQRELIARTEGKTNAFPDFSTLELLAAGRNFAPRFYGGDDRNDLGDVGVMDPYLQANLDATVLIVDSTIVKQSEDDKRWTVDAKPLHELDVCKCERFSEQRSTAAGFPCTGFLITKHLVLTASHCVPRRSALVGRRFVFGFYRRRNADAPTEFAENDVQIADRIVFRSSIPCEDLAIVLLKEDIAHSTVRRSTKPVKQGTDVYEIGYPIGLPAKYAPGANVRHADTTKLFFVANTDGYDGNSGSPVFNAATHEAEGVHVRGETSLAMPCGCWTSTWCPNIGCSGEEFTWITRLPPLYQLPTPVPDDHVKCPDSPPSAPSRFFQWAYQKYAGGY